MNEVIVQNIMISIITGTITGIITGLLTGIIVSRHYRKKDNIRDRIRYLLDVRKCIINLDKECNQLLIQDINHKNYKEIVAILLRISNIEVPISFKWLNLDKKEQEYIKEFEGIYSNIKDNVGTIWFNNEEMDGVSNNYHSGMDKSLTDDVYEETLNELIDNIQSARKKLNYECLRFKENWPILEEIIKKYNEIKKV